MKFNQRFQDFAEIEKGINLFLNPFVDTEEVKEDMQLEVIEIQCDDTPYKSMRKAHAPCQKNTLFIWLTLYLYMSDCIFSFITFIKSKLRSRMTNSHLCNILWATTRWLSPDLTAIVETIWTLSITVLSDTYWWVKCNSDKKCLTIHSSVRHKVLKSCSLRYPLQLKGSWPRTIYFFLHVAPDMKRTSYTIQSIEKFGRVMVLDEKSGKVHRDHECLLHGNMHINLFKRISNLPMGSIFGVLYCIF